MEVILWPTRLLKVSREGNEKVFKLLLVAGDELYIAFNNSVDWMPFEEVEKLYSQWQVNYREELEKKKAELRSGEL